MNSDIVEQLFVSKGYSMQHILSQNQDIYEMLRRRTPISYEDFIEQIDVDIENIITDTEAGKKHHHSKGEDEMTEHLLTPLKRLYPSVFHDVHQGGHCDIYIESKSDKGVTFKWIAEAKLWEGATWGDKGLFSQLLGSYANGGCNQNRGGVIFYSSIKSGGAYVMDTWKKHIEAKEVPIIDEREDLLRFSTTHMLNNGIGPEFTVRHYCIDVYHQPTQDALDKQEEKAAASKTTD